MLVVLPFTGLLLLGTAVFFLVRYQPRAMTNLPRELSAAAHLPMPDRVKGIYLTAFTAGAKNQLAELLGLVERTELNTVVVDVKKESGALAFVPLDSELYATTSTVFLPPLEELTASLHQKGIYVIARISVFQDPWFAEHSPWALRNKEGGLWTDRKGVRWTDPAAEEVWRYNAAIAVEAWRRGFDEIQFDYIRFPTDGEVGKIVYPVWDGAEPKRSVIQRFFRFLHDELAAKGIPVSVDLFGYSVRLDDDDLGIGQHAADALPYVTAVSPMVYPSHYYRGSYGFDRPAEHPGEIVAKSMEIARQLVASSTPRSATIRPWLQDFDIGAVYDAKKVRAEIDAAEAGGVSGWLLWNARNVYTEEALNNESKL